MSSNYPNTPIIDTTQSQFQEELSAVEEKLALAHKELYAPLSGLIRAQIQQAKPHLRAAVVLAATIQAGETPELREKRIYLGAALEMLYIALNVHQILLNNSEQIEDTIDKSILGSTVLAGDYCFSHAASLAAQTDSPEIVSIFSQTLQTISEKQLRSLFNSTSFNSTSNHQDQLNSDSQTFNASADLFWAGIHSADALVKFEPDTLAAHKEIVESLIAQLSHNIIHLPIGRTPLAANYKERWTTFVDWQNHAA